MRICAIYNVWADYDILKYSADNIRPVVDGIIIIYSEKSNYGELHKPVIGDLPGFAHCFHREPQHKTPRESETDKRNYGLKKARELGFTHFVQMDADEFYKREEFSKDVEKFHVKPDLQGLVCASKVYFKSPKLTIGKDVTLVPFIHKLTPSIKNDFNKKYPYAWYSGKIRIDPTRSFNINSGVEWSEITMHHYSWVRSDYQKKIRNSTARANIERSDIVQDLVLAKAGYFCKFYGKTISRAENTFNLPEFDVLEIQNIQSLEAVRSEKLRD